ncbi:MAG: DUF4352 domain-containing protein, partial [Ruminococcus sp.]|nr:DUF4352 domain-containing protein [Ruminococcus sp.]
PSISHTPLINNEGTADNETTISVGEETSVNDTSFVLNRVIDSGEKPQEGGGTYYYLDVTIRNLTDISYGLNALNNFYVLTSDGNEYHFDVRTQLYAINNIENYLPNPFEVPSNGEISGIVGGFVVPENTENLTVCFFPSKDDINNKSDVIKVDVTSSDITK